MMTATWNCVVCNLENNSKRQICQACFSPPSLTVLPTQRVLHYVNEDIMNNECLPNEIVDIILIYIINLNLFQPGMVFFGQVSLGEWFKGPYLFLLTKMKNVKIHDKVSYIIESFDFDSIYIQPFNENRDIITTGDGRLKLIDDGLFNQYTITMTEHSHHIETLRKSGNLPCQFDLKLILPDNKHYCKWNNWDEYMDRMGIAGWWYHDTNAEYSSNGYVYCYQIHKWLGQIDVKQYLNINQLQTVPNIKHNTLIETAIQEIENIVQNIKLNQI